MIAPDAASLRRKLLGWYRRHGRDLPWRAAAGTVPDPYRVWLSEIMLQQTTVATVQSYFGDFVARWPTVGDLAAAPREDVLHAWQGLGYYARARNLHRCAGRVAAAHGGNFPNTEAGLRALPGIGTYTAAAVAAIAFGRKATPVDGNVERVVSRLRAVATPLPAAKGEIADHAHALTPDRGAGDFAQAMMDLGATVCTPRRPGCGRCPWRRDCAAHAAGTMEDYPRKAPRRRRATRYGVAFWIERGDGAVLLRRRPDAGLLGGMTEFPSTPWRPRRWPRAEAAAAAPVAADWRPLPGTVEHGFTHFVLKLGVWRGHTDAAVEGALWCPPERFGDHALPTVMKKVGRHVLAARPR